jgi:hypothetical protein
MEINKHLDPTYVNNKLEEYNELAQYYSILCTKQQMDDSNVKPNEWVGTSRSSILGRDAEKIGYA